MTEQAAPIPSHVDLDSIKDPIERLAAARKMQEGRNKPADGKPADGKPEEGKPADGKPADGKPEEGKPADGKPADGKPEEGNPEEGKPADGKPADGKAEKKFSAKDYSLKAQEEGKPADGKPADGKPAEAKPGESDLSKQEREELASLRAILSKPSVKTVLKAEESGKDFLTYYEELKSQDPYKMPLKDIYKLQLQEQGLTEVEMDRRVTKFTDELDEDEQLDRVAVFRKQLKTKFDQLTSDYTPKLDKPVDMWDDLNAPYHQAAKTYEGKKILDVVVTPELAKATADFYKDNSLVNLTKDGKLDPDDLFKKTFVVNNIGLIINQARQEAYDEGFSAAEEANGVGKPLPSQNGGGAPQPRKSENTETRKRVDNLIASLPQR